MDNGNYVDDDDNDDDNDDDAADTDYDVPRRRRWRTVSRSPSRRPPCR
jgi:hypothetical protein